MTAAVDPLAGYLGRRKLPVWRSIVAGDPCAYCGTRPAQGPRLDHIEPRSHGGANGWENLTVACAWCNLFKFNFPLLEHLLRLHVELPEFVRLMCRGLEEDEAFARARAAVAAGGPM